MGQLQNTPQAQKNGCTCWLYSATVAREVWFYHGSSSCSLVLHLPCVQAVIPCWLCFPGSGTWQLFATLPERGDATYAIRWSRHLGFLGGFGVCGNFLDGGRPNFQAWLLTWCPLSCVVGSPLGRRTWAWREVSLALAGGGNSWVA